MTAIERDKRTFEIYHLPKSYATDGFTGIKTFVRMRSKKHSAKRADTRCFISNVSDESLIISAIEGRWCIENGFHKEKDNFLNEDRFRSAQKNTVLNLAIMNNLALQLVRIYQVISGLNLHKANIMKVIENSKGPTLDQIDQQLEEVQMKLIQTANQHQDCDALPQQIMDLRKQKEKV